MGNYLGEFEEVVISISNFPSATGGLNFGGAYDKTFAGEMSSPKVGSRYPIFEPTDDYRIAF